MIWLSARESAASTACSRTRRALVANGTSASGAGSSGLATLVTRHSATAWAVPFVIDHCCHAVRRRLDQPQQQVRVLDLRAAVLGDRGSSKEQCAPGLFVESLKHLQQRPRVSVDVQIALPVLQPNSLSADGRQGDKPEQHDATRENHFGVLSPRNAIDTIAHVAVSNSNRLRHAGPHTASQESDDPQHHGRKERGDDHTGQASAGALYRLGWLPGSPPESRASQTRAARGHRIARCDV